MIPFDFEYYRPETLDEALTAFNEVEENGKYPVYYGGGSELISMARAGSITFGAVIDVKGIPELRVHDITGDKLILGAALTLSELTEAKSFPLLAKCAGRVADHTMQCKITLGGNLKSAIIYRETVLALLLADAKITAAGPVGIRELAFDKVFKKNLILPRNELIVSISVEQKMLEAPYFHIKKTKNEKIDYPLITVAALVDGFRKLRAAFSGLAPYPLRDKGVESILNDRTMSCEARAAEACAALSGIIQEDISGTREYREFVLKNTIINLLEELSG